MSNQDRKIGLAALSLEVKGRREHAKTVAQKSQQESSTGTIEEVGTAIPEKKRRMAPVDPRPRPKKRKFGLSNS